MQHKLLMLYGSTHQMGETALVYTYMIQAVHSVESTSIRGYPCKRPGNACFISDALNIPPSFLGPCHYFTNLFPCHNNDFCGIHGLDILKILIYFLALSSIVGP